MIRGRQQPAPLMPVAAFSTYNNPYTDFLSETDSLGVVTGGPAVNTIDTPVIVQPTVVTSQPSIDIAQSVVNTSPATTSGSSSGLPGSSTSKPGQTGTFITGEPASQTSSQPISTGKSSTTRLESQILSSTSSATSPSPLTSNSASASSSSHLSAGAGAGIAIGAIAVLSAIIALIVLALRKHKRRKREVGLNNQAASSDAPPSAAVSAEPKKDVFQLDGGPDTEIHELGGRTRPELEGKDRSELEAKEWSGPEHSKGTQQSES